MNPQFMSERSSLIPSSDSESHLVPSTDIPRAEGSSAGAQIATTLAENNELRAQLEQLRAERNRLVENQRRMMEVLGVASPEKLIHDLRNVLNERDLLKALVDAM
jgi:hypothetical protein